MTKEITVAAKHVAPRVHDVIPLYDADKFEHMQRVAGLMASMTLIPEGLRNGQDHTAIAANCFLIVNQAVKWEMDPFAVAQMVSVIKGRLCYEGKLIHAVIEKELSIRLRYDYHGEKGREDRSVIVSGKFTDEKDPRMIEGKVSDWKTTHSGSPWSPKTYDRQLAYRGAREWARRHAPGVLLGVYERDEIAEDYKVIEDDGPPPAPKNIPVGIEAPPEAPQDAQASEIEAAPEGSDSPEAQSDPEGGDKPYSGLGERPIIKSDVEDIEDEGPPNMADEKKAASADDILDAAAIELKACKDAKSVKSVEEQFSKIVMRLPIRADKEMFAEMVSDALKRVTP